MAFCTRCGNPVQDGSPTCPTCQAPQAPPYPAAPPAYPQAPPAYPPQYPQQPYPQGYPQYPQQPVYTQQPAYPPGYAAHVPHAAQGGRNKWIIVAAVAAAIVFYLFKTGFFADPKDVVNRCLDGIQEMDSEKVMATLHPSVREQYRGGLTFLLQTLKSTGRQIQIVDRNLTVVKKEGDRCVVDARYSITSPGSTQKQTDQQQLPLMKSDGEWFLMDIPR